MIFKRIILIVLDGVGCGALPDAAEYGVGKNGDSDANTLSHVAAHTGGIELPTLQQLGLGNIVAMAGVPAADNPLASWGRMAEVSVGKDSTTGHWEIAGGVQLQPYATYPHGFPAEIIDAFTKIAGQPPLGNVVISGIAAIAQYGAQHLVSGRPIVYTSEDSVFQIAAHEDILPPDKLYDLCLAMRKVLDPYRVGRVIARPFVGTVADNFVRTSRRRDFSLQPPLNMLDHLTAADIPVIAVGKIRDIFCGRGIKQHYSTTDNQHGMMTINSIFNTLEQGLIFANLIDYDMLYGHRRDVNGFAVALQEFDSWLGGFLPKMAANDLLLITADHGCDPTMPGSDHTREYVPLLTYVGGSEHCGGVDLAVRNGFNDIAATITENYAVTLCVGNSFLDQLGGG